MPVILASLVSHEMPSKSTGGGHQCRPMNRDAYHPDSINLLKSENLKRLPLRIALMPLLRRIASGRYHRVPSTSSILLFHSNSVSSSILFLPLIPSLPLPSSLVRIIRLGDEKIKNQQINSSN